MFPFSSIHSKEYNLFLPPVRSEADPGLVVEHDPDDLVGQLVAEAVLVRVVHPLDHPHHLARVRLVLGRIPVIFCTNIIK